MLQAEVIRRAYCQDRAPRRQAGPGGARPRRLLGREFMWTKEGLVDMTQEKLRDYKFILVSNREPYMHRSAGGGQIECVQPASGLTVALDPVMRACGGTWIAHGSGDADW